MKIPSVLFLGQSHLWRNTLWVTDVSHSSIRWYFLETWGWWISCKRTSSFSYFPINGKHFRSRLRRGHMQTCPWNSLKTHWLMSCYHYACIILTCEKIMVCRTYLKSIVWSKDTVWYILQMMFFHEMKVRAQQQILSHKMISMKVFLIADWIILTATVTTASFLRHKLKEQLRQSIESRDEKVESDFIQRFFFVKMTQFDLTSKNRRFFHLSLKLSIVSMLETLWVEQLRVFCALWWKRLCDHIEQCDVFDI